jgi:hypothetical protein
VLDVRGRVVATVEDGALPAGMHARHWEARGFSGGALASGMYFLRLEHEGEVRTRRLLVLR